MAKHESRKIGPRPTREEILAAVPAKKHKWPASMPQALRDRLQQADDDYIVDWALGAWDHARRGELIAEELKHRAGWYFLSFTTNHKFAGAAVVRGHGTLTAYQRAYSQGLMGRVGAVKYTTLTKVDMDRIPVNLRNHLLTEAGVRAAGLDGKA